MSDDPKVVQIRGGVPLLNDIPGRLRHLADQLENDEINNIEAAYVLLVHPQGFPHLRAYGKIDGENCFVNQVELAKYQFIKALADD